MPKVSVIIPTLNEDRSGVFPLALESLMRSKGMVDGDVEIIVSDGGSADSTINRAKEAGAKLIRSCSLSRAQRINDGVAAAAGEMILLHHPRSILDPKGIDFLLSNMDKLEWGGFSHCFDVAHPFLKFTSWYSNKIRARFGGIVYLDHCAFAKKSLLEDIGPIKPVEIFEDTLLSQMLLKASGAPVILPFESKTSAIRFVEKGFWRQGLINQWMKLGFYLGLDHKNMNRLYENKTRLNSASGEKKK